ncbi:MAG: hypothetical protein ABI651_10530 [Verrucomicrobiota bacterium]
MKRALIYPASLLAAVLLAGCETVPPGAERGPHGTIAYDVFVEASAPGARIEANGQAAGTAPVHLKIFGDPDGTFHDFGSPYFVIKASPITTNQFEQVRFFGTGKWFGPEDHIPKQLSFDMNQPTPANPPYGPPVYGYPYPGPPAYYYGSPYYRGPQFRFYVNPGYPHHYRHW